MSLTESKKHLLGILIGLSLFSMKAICEQKVHNSLQEIMAAEKRPMIKFVREWSGENETDENKLFFEPKDMAFNNKGQIFILEATKIRIYDESGKYLKTISRAGQGPGDLLGASILEIDSDDNLIVCDSDNRRIQTMNTEGRVLANFPLKMEQSGPMLVTGKKEIIMSNRIRSAESSSLWQYFDYGGRLLRENGERKANSSVLETLYRNEYHVDLDKTDCVFASAAYSPLVRKYSPAGEIWMEITYEPPFEVPDVKEFKTFQGTFVDKESVCRGIGVDSSGRVFLLSLTRLMRLEEKKIGMSFASMGKDPKSYSSGRVKANVDPQGSALFQILAFDDSGKIQASYKLNTYANKIKIHKKRLFLIDSFVNMKILEYQIME